MRKFSFIAVFFSAISTVAMADGHSTPSVSAVDQSVSNGVVSAREIISPVNGWMVVHRTDGSKPGPVVGHAPLRAGFNTDVAAILTETVLPGDQLMLMVHGEEGGIAKGIFEYSLGAKEDGPIRQDGQLVMKIVTVK